MKHAILIILVGLLLGNITAANETEPSEETKTSEATQQSEGTNLSQKTQALQQQIFGIETAFAKTMADRDFEAFKHYLSKEAVFLSGKKPRRGIAQIAAQWEKYFNDPKAPFSWKPEVVQVLDSGTLAISTGPVFNSKGKLFSYYTSTWRLEEDGQWRIIFDKGNKACLAKDKN